MKSMHFSDSNLEHSVILEHRDIRTTRTGISPERGSEWNPLVPVEVGRQDR